MLRQALLDYMMSSLQKIKLISKFTGILGFTFNTTFLTATHFNQNSRKKSINEACHVNFKIKLAIQLNSFILPNEKPITSLSVSTIDFRGEGEKLVSLRHKKQGLCNYCRHSQPNNSFPNKTNYFCQLHGSDKPLC